MIGVALFHDRGGFGPSDINRLRAASNHLSSFISAVGSVVTTLPVSVSYTRNFAGFLVAMDAR